MTQKVRERVEMDHGVVIPASKPEKRGAPAEDEADDAAEGGGAG